MAANDLSTTGTWVSTSRSCLMSEQFFSCGSDDEHPTGSGDSELGPRVGDPLHNLQQRESSSESEQARLNEQSTLLSRSPRQQLRDEMTSLNDNPAVVAAAQIPAATVATRRTATPLIRASSRASSKVETSRWRWLMLIIFVLNMSVSSMIMSTFTSSDSMLENYYSRYDSGWKPWVKHLAVYDSVVKALLLLPSAWMLVRYELKFTVVFASSATALGTALRLAGAGSEHFAVLVAGQLVSSFGALMLVSVTFFSEVWFSHRGRATSTAFSAVIGPNLGVIVSYVLGPLVILKTKAGVGCEAYFLDWSYYLMGQALFAFVVLLITVIVFRMAPPNPPSLSRRLEISAHSAEVTFCEQLKAYLTSFLEFGRNCFLLFLLPAGIVIGASGSLVPLFSQIQANSNKSSNTSFQGTDQDIAYIEISTSICSIITALLMAVLIDCTKLFYGVVLSVTAFATVVYLSITSNIHYIVFYVTLGLVGASVAAFQVFGLEYSAEMTFPIPEGTSAAMFYFTGTVLSIVMRALINELSVDKVYIVVWVITGLTIIGFMLLIFVRPELKRKNIDQKKTNHPICECRLL